MSVAIVVLTHNRVHLLRRCVEQVLLRTSRATQEIVIWDNGSTDGTAAYLATVDDPRVRVVTHPENIGLNGYARGFALTSSDYLVEIDDDVIEAPWEWDARLLDAYRALPEVGYLAANLVDNPHDWTSRIMYGQDAHLYSYKVRNGFRLKLGPTGGGCAMTDRELYRRVGGFRQSRRQIFWQEDADYIYKIAAAGSYAAYLDDLKVTHAGGPFYAEPAPAKSEYWRRYNRGVRRKDMIKRALLAFPRVRTLNRRHGWFVEPD
jgi:GT2 family glycosyltransferase